MNPEVKQKWIDALRSGEYAQGRSTLKTDNFYCCLGVLCDLHQKETGLGKWDGGLYVSIANNGDRCDAYLPAVVMDWAGLESCNPVVMERTSTLAQENDAGWSFGMIAQIIEEQL